MIVTIVPQTLIFDFDGTLVDSEKVTTDLARPILSRYLGRPISDYEINGLKGKAWKNVFKDWFPGKAGQVYDEIVKNWNTRKTEILAYEGISELLSELESKGIRMGIVSSRETHLICEDLERLSLRSFFETVVGQTDTTRHKPDPDPLLLAAAKMDVERENCIYIGDQPWDIIASRAAGMYSGAALWGEGDLQVLSASSPDYIFHTPLEIIHTLFS